MQTEKRNQEREGKKMPVLQISPDSLPKTAAAIP